MCCKCCSVRQQKAWLYTIATLFVVIGVILVAVGPTIVKKLIYSSLALTTSSYTFKQWETVPVPSYMTFYLYNWTNSQEVHNPNVKPHFEEHGPYVFSEKRLKEDLKWDNENNYVTYFARRTWYFDYERSKGSPDDLIISPNIATMTGSSNSKKLNKIFRKIVNFALNREGGTLVMKHTAIEWIFDGFYDHLFDFAERLHSPLIPIYDNHFAFFYKRNDSKVAEGTYTIHTGKSDLTQMGDLKRWNGSDHTGYWEGECGKVNGSTGELYSPNKSWDENISIFLFDAARFINLFPQEKVIYRGVEAWLYTSTEQTFDSGHIAPDTKCFCVKGHECPKSGVIDYSPAAYRAPVYLSHPHFYMADESYLANTTGLKPDAEKHKIFLLLEPTLGVPLDMLGQVLISGLVEADEYIDLLRDVAHKFYAPLFIVQLQAEISDEILNHVKFALNAPALIQYIGIGCIVTGIILLIIGFWLTWTYNWRGDSKDHKEDRKH